MFKRIVKRSKEDDGNAVIILGLMLIMALLLVGGLLLDVSKAYQIKSSYVDAAKKATQTAIMEQTSEGYLRPESVGLLIETYENVTRPAVINTEGYFSKCDNFGDNDVVLTVKLVNEAGARLTVGSISRASVPKTGRANPTPQQSSANAKQISSMMGLDSASMRNSIRNSKFTSIVLEVTEGTENVILPGAFKITQSDDASATNMKCQKMEIAARANVFIGDESGRYD